MLYKALHAASASFIPVVWWPMDLEEKGGPTGVNSIPVLRKPRWSFIERLRLITNLVISNRRHQKCHQSYRSGQRKGDLNSVRDKQCPENYRPCQKTDMGSSVILAAGTQLFPSIIGTYPARVAWVLCFASSCVQDKE